MSNDRIYSNNVFFNRDVSQKLRQVEINGLYPKLNIYHVSEDKLYA